MPYATGCVAGNGGNLEITCRNNARKIWCNSRKTLLLHHEKSRSGAEVARQAHNLEVMGSNPVSATKAIRLLSDEEVA